MLSKTNRNIKSISDRNKEQLNNHLVRSNRIDALYEDVIVLEVLERDIKSKFIENYTCKNSLEFVCAYSRLHNHYYAHKIESINEDVLRSTYGSNQNIIGREFKLEVKSFSKDDIRNGKIVFKQSASESKEKMINANTDIVFSLGNMNFVSGSLIDRSEWKFIEPKSNLGYIWNNIIPVEKVKSDI